MENIGEAMQETMQRGNLYSQLTNIRQTVLNDDSVQAFLAQENIGTNDPIVTKSLSKLYEFVREKEKMAKGEPTKFPLYTPKLIMNYHYIDVVYVPNKKYKDQKLTYDKQRRVDLIYLPKELRKASLRHLEIDSKSKKEAVDAVSEFVMDYVDSSQKPTGGLYLHGPFGVGKTHLMAAMAIELAKDGHRTTLIHFPEFVERLKGNFGDNNNVNGKRIDDIKQAEILVLDDIGAETNSAWMRDGVLGIIMQFRMDEGLPTFFTSNLNFNELEEHFAESKDGREEVKARRLMQRVRLSEAFFVNGGNRRRTYN